MTAQDELNAFLVHYHENATKSCWLRVCDHPKDSPDNEAELTLRDDLALRNEEAKELAKIATEWRGTTPQGKRRAVLLTKKNKMDKQIKLGQILEENDIITPDEVKEFNELEKTFSQMQRATTKKRRLKQRQLKN